MVYSNGTKITRDQIVMVLWLRHCDTWVIAVVSLAGYNLQFQSHQPYIVAMPFSVDVLLAQWAKITHRVAHKKWNTRALVANVDRAIRKFWKRLVFKCSKVTGPHCRAGAREWEVPQIQLWSPVFNIQGESGAEPPARSRGRAPGQGVRGG